MDGAWNDPVIVAGAGIAGLAAAFRLQQAGLRVLVLEKAEPDRVGGRMSGVERDGCHLDLGAPLLALRYRRMLRLIAEAGLADQVLPASDLMGVAVGDGRVHRGRTGTPGRLLRPGMFRSVPWLDRARLLADLRRRRTVLHPADMTGVAAEDWESVIGYALRRNLHARTLHYLLDPMVGTLCLDEPGTTAAPAALLFLAFLASSGGLFTSAHGSGFLPRGLAAQLPVAYRTEVTGVVEAGDEVRVSHRCDAGPEVTRSAPAAILAVPPLHLPELCPQLPVAWSEVAAASRYSHLVQVTFVLDGPTAEQAVLVHAPHWECPDVDSFVLQHNMSAQRLPAGTGLITTYLSGAASERLWDRPDTEITTHVLAQLGRIRLLPEAAGRCRAAHVDRIYPAVVRRPPGAYQALARASATGQPFTRIRWAGGDHLGHSTTIGSLTSGQQAADQVIAALAAAR